MNKVYKVIWSKVRNCYMVVSELAKSNGKNTGSTDKRRKLTAGIALAAMALTLNLGMAGAAEAANVTFATSGNYEVQGGYGAEANWKSTIAVGHYAGAGKKLFQPDAQRWAYVDWQQTIKNDSELVNETAVQNATTYAALVDALNIVGTSTANNYLNQLKATATNLQSKGVGSDYAIAVGRNAQANGESTIAVGNSAQTYGESTIAVGWNAGAGRLLTLGEAQSMAYNDLQHAIKHDSELVNEESVQNANSYVKLVNALNGVGSSTAINYLNKLNARFSDLQNRYVDSRVNSDYAIAMGYKSLAISQDAISLGHNARALEKEAISLGHNARSQGVKSIAIGSGARATHNSAIAIGTSAGISRYGIPLDTDTASDTNSIAIGRSASNFTYGYLGADEYYGNAQNSIAIGYEAHTHAANAFAIGVSTDATAERSFAIGTSSTNIEKAHQGTRSVGQGSIVFGDTASVIRDKHILPESPSDDGPNRSTDTRANDAMAMGTNSQAGARNAVALGGGMSYTYHSIEDVKDTPNKRMTNITKYFDGSKWEDRAVGTGAKVGDDADGAVAIGGAAATVKIKKDNNDNPIDNVYFPTMSPTDSLEITNYTAAARATVARSVSLGTGSVANREAMNPMNIPSLAPSYATSGYDVTTGKAYAGDYKDLPTWKSTLAAVSIGEETGLYKDENDNLIAKVINTRQITGVAAGSADTDAVNVAQLKLSRIEIKAGNNITVTTDVAPEGHLIYTINGMKGGAVASDDRAVTLLPPSPPDSTPSDSPHPNTTDGKTITSPYLHINGLDDAPAADYAQAQAPDSIAMGRSATVTEISPRGVAIGNRAMVNNKDAVALGSNASATNHFSVALGPNAEASIHTSVALGSHSVTTAEDKAGIRTGKYGYDVVTNSQYKGVDRFSPTWQSTAGSVSVGGGVEPATGDTVTRRISNVAAGIKDTDVVNVAQLKRAANYLTDHRSTSIGTNANGEREIVSPYLAMHGVKEAAQAKSLIDTYKDVKEYTGALQNDISTLKGEKASLNRDVTNLTKEISDLDARMAAINDKKSEAYKDLANERAILNEEKTTLSKELNEVTEMLAEREDLLKTAETDYNKAKDLADDHAYVDGEKSFAQGSGTKVVGKESMAQGSGSTVIGDQSMAIGTGHEVYGSNSGAIGDPNIVAADESYAVGNNNNIGGVTGDGEELTTKNIFVYGNSNKIEAGKSHVYVLGSNVTTVESNSVILGNESAVYAEANNRTAGTGAYKSETINGKTYNYAGGDKEVGVVSVGNADAPRRIQNVAPGKVSAESTDAINGSQLYSAIENVNTNLGDQISNVDSRATKGIAGAAALAALHPLDFDPDDKLQFSAGMGHYRGKTAAAVGLFYRPDEKVMFNIGGTMGNGENLINAGITFSLDRTPRVTGSRTALTKEVVALREHVARQDAQIAELTALVRQLAGNAGVNMPAASSLPTAMPALFPDNLDNKWAYDKLEELEQLGYIKGYAGHTLTRSQFAAALDMAMKRGAKLEERLVKAFEPELSHVRVAHVEGNGNEEGKWYERPRFSYDKLEKKHEIEKKNARIVPAKQK